MKILVCVKQVPDPDEPVVPDVSGQWLAPGAGRWTMNRLDAFAMEHALVLKDTAGATVEAVSVGPDRAEAVVRRALAMGAGAGFLAPMDERFPDPMAVAALLAGLARQRQPDLILCGAMSEDSMAGVTGPMLAALLFLPFASSVVEIAPAGSGQSIIRAVRELEGGMAEELEIRLPAVLSIQSSGITPRYPVLSHVLRANKQEIFRPEAGAPFLPQPRLRSLETALPPPPPPGRFLTGTAAEKAEKLCDILMQRGLL
ncbi:MAG: hypothetical protein KKA60_10780 [Proteobacteria bacterium]|nr:hypothetical protein [Pseudomonadota bacterium]